MQKVPEIYTDFFSRCLQEGQRDIFCIGGRRSAKTISTYGFLHFCCQNVRLNVLTLCAEYPPLQRTMEDFTMATGMVPMGSQRYGMNAQMSNGSMFQFVSLDSKERAQGTACDILFINEAINVKQEVIDTIAPGVRLCTFYNLNPTKRARVLEKSTKHNTLCTSWRDNPYLTEEQKDEFEQLRIRAMRPNATPYDVYMYRVYYLGEFSQLAGKVFPDPSLCTLEEYRSIPAKECVATDFGFAMDGDPTAVVGVKLYNKSVYVHQYVYQRGITSSEEMAHIYVANGFDSHTLMVGDYGGMGESRMRDLRTADNGRWSGEISQGFQMYNAIKGGVMADIAEVLSLDGITVTDSSVYLREEMDTYEFSDSGKPKGADHAIDAMRYATIYLRRMGC